MKYMDIIDDAWDITWKHKFLWIFGAIAGSELVSNVLFENTLPFFSNINWNLFSLLATILVIFSISLFGYFALIKAILLIREENVPTIREIFSYGLSYFFKNFYLVLLLIVMALAIFWVLLNLLGLQQSRPPSYLTLFLFLLFAFLVYIVFSFATISFVDQKIGVTKAIQFGFAMTLNHVLPILGLGFVLLVLSIVSIFLIGIPFSMMIYLLTQVTSNSLDPASYLLILSPLILITWGIVETFTRAFLVSAYLQLRDEPSQPTEATT